MKQLASLTAIAAFAISGMVGGAVAPALAADGPTLTAVKKRGELICGVHQGCRKTFKIPEDGCPNFNEIEQKMKAWFDLAHLFYLHTPHATPHPYSYI